MEIICNPVTDSSGEPLSPGEEICFETPTTTTTTEAPTTTTTTVPTEAPELALTGAEDTFGLAAIALACILFGIGLKSHKEDAAVFFIFVPALLASAGVIWVLAYFFGGL